MENGIPDNIIQLNLHNLIIVEMHQRETSGVVKTLYMPLLKLSYVEEGKTESCEKYYSYIALKGNVPAVDSAATLRVQLNWFASHYMDKGVVVTMFTHQQNYTGEPIHDGRIFDSSEVDLLYAQAFSGMTNFYELWEQGLEYAAIYINPEDESINSVPIYACLNYFDTDDKITADAELEFQDINERNGCSLPHKRIHNHLRKRMRVDNHYIIRSKDEEDTPIYLAAARLKGSKKETLYCSCKEDAYQFVSEEDALKLALWTDSFPMDSFEIEVVEIPAVVEIRPILDMI